LQESVGATQHDSMEMTIMLKVKFTL